MKALPYLLVLLYIAGIMPGLGTSLPAGAADYATTYTYDDLGRPLSVTVGEATANFAYDAVGNRTVVSMSPGSTAPWVVVVAPSAGATGVSPHVTIVATFSRQVNPATVTTGPAGTFRLSGPGNTIVPGTVSVHGLEAVFVPNDPLQNGILYTATITTGVADLDGRALTQQKVWSFTIGVAPDLTSPTVLTTTPASGASNVPLTSTVTALFSEALDPLTITSSSFLVMNGAYSVSATVDYNVSTHIATLVPDAPLDPGIAYAAVLLSTIADPSGNRMTTNKEWTFSTASTGPQVPPGTDTLIPYDGQTDLPLRTSVGAIFTKAMDGTTVNGSTFTVKKGAVTVPGSVSYNPVKHQATFIPTAALAPETVYTATLTTGITDTAGVPLPSPVTWSFTTAPLPPFLVTCNLTGAGSGIIDSTPPNIACGTTSCSGNFPQNSTVLLSPVPYDTSLFAGWGAPCSGTGDCTFIVNADTTLSAAFDLKPARVVGAPLQYFTSLQAACDEETTVKTIQSRAVIFTENLNLAQARKILLKGGYGPDYAGQSGDTTVKGKLTIGRGALTVERLVVK